MNYNKKEIEEKYNINIQTPEGEKRYWELHEYFTKEIEEDNFIVETDYCHMCCHRVDIKSIREEFEEKIKEIIENNPEECEDPCRVGCHSNEENNNSIIQPPVYKP